MYGIKGRGLFICWQEAVTKRNIRYQLWMVDWVGNIAHVHRKCLSQAAKPLVARYYFIKVNILI